MAFQESSKIGHEFQPDGTTIIVDAVGEAHRINMEDIGTEARRIILEIEESIYQWLPQKNSDAFNGFPDISQLSDDLNHPRSIFHQKGNAAVLEPIVSTVQKSLLQSLSSEEDRLAWLQHNEHLLSLFLVAVALTCGIPPRAFQFKSLQFDRCAETGASRGLFLISGCLAIGKPAAKQSEKSRHECLWFLPPALAYSLLFYLAVLRPVVIEVLTLSRKEVARQSTHIFCRTIPRTNGLCSWNGDEITRMLREHTKNINLTLSVGLLRQLYTAFFRQYFPDLCGTRAPADSPMDRQAQHRFYTGQRHCGLTIGNVPRSLGIDVTEARQLGAISQLLHIVFELRLPDAHWKLLLQHSHFLPSLQHDRHALDTARLSVLREYGILSRGAGPPAALKARAVLTTCPFSTPPARSGETFGDAVLVEVLHACLFGEGGPSHHDQTPPGGYPVADMARAISLIVQAVEEWTDGNYRAVVRQVDLTADQHFKELEKLAEKHLRNAKDNWSDEWLTLCRVVRTHRPQNLRRDWNMRGLPKDTLDT
ncbi:hypothetical protein JVU11DRAFT_12733 [Chiua virens]|nr:hypothetical protein JVU11DRAFT_12733 [Chiua virens]